MSRKYTFYIFLVILAEQPQREDLRVTLGRLDRAAGLAREKPGAEGHLLAGDLETRNVVAQKKKRGAKREIKRQTAFGTFTRKVDAEARP